MLNYGIRDELIQHGSREDMLNEAGLTKKGLLNFIQQHLEKPLPLSEVKTA